MRTTGEVHPVSPQFIADRHVVSPCLDMSLDSTLISFAVSKKSGFTELQRAGITEEHLTDEYAKVWKFLTKTKKKHGHVPSKSVVATRYPEVELHKVRDRDLPIIVAEVQQRKKFMDFLESIDDASRINGPEDIDSAIAELQGQLNALAVRNGASSLVDLFGAEATARILANQKLRRSGKTMGLPTGLKRLDLTIGGLQKGRMCVAIGRPGTGKSWIDLLFVAAAVLHGAKVGLYPLEMTLEETALRLYTIFSCKMFGSHKALKNLDLANGRISKAKIVRLTNILEDKFAGQLWLADIGTMSDPYTVERIEAEQEMYKFDLLWVDYITLMKSNVGRDGAEDHTTIKALSNGMKQIAVRQGTVSGVSAQVSRQAITGHTFIPRLEHIAYGDAIGQDADHVISLNRRGPHLYYGLVKNRHGPEIGKVRCRFAVDSGSIEEDSEQDEEAE